MGIETAIIGSVVAGAVSVGASELLKDDVEAPELPDPGLARKQAAEEARSRQQSMSRFLARSQQLGPVQLKAPGIRI